MDYASISLMLSAAIAPVVLISGIGLLLMSMTNRYARPLDRIRILIKEYELAKKADDKNHALYKEEIDILYRRAKILQTAILFAILSISSVVVMIMTLFVSGYFGLTSSYLIIFLFCSSMISLLISVLYFLADFTISVRAIKIELQKVTESLSSIEDEKVDLVPDLRKILKK
jgi:hypothetical protein